MRRRHLLAILLPSLLAGCGLLLGDGLDVSLANGADGGDTGPGTGTDGGVRADGGGSEGAVDGAVTQPMDVTALAAGWTHTCALRADTTVECWGSGDTGELGDGLGQASATPVLVKDLSSVGALASGSRYTCALYTTGLVTCWGYGAYGQLGQKLDKALTPALVPNLYGVSAIAAGAKHACALLSSGMVKCWGTNGAGQLGNGGSTSSGGPTPVVALSSGAVAIGAGQEHTCAVMATGGVKCWGRGTSGQLGQAAMTTQASPVDVENLTGAKAVACGDSHTCVLMTNGTVRCFGYNADGELGTGASSAPTATPTEVPGLSDGAQITATALHTCARRNDGAVFCWGRNDDGRIGDGTITDGGVRSVLAPVQVVAPLGGSGFLSPTAMVSAGALMTCAGTGPTTYCWGLGGLLGNGGSKSSSVPVEVAALP